MCAVVGMLRSYFLYFFCVNFCQNFPHCSLTLLISLQQCGSFLNFTGNRTFLTITDWHTQWLAEKATSNTFTDICVYPILSEQASLHHRAALSGGVSRTVSGYGQEGRDGLSLVVFQIYYILKRAPFPLHTPLNKTLGETTSSKQSSTSNSSSNSKLALACYNTTTNIRNKRLT